MYPKLKVVNNKLVLQGDFKFTKGTLTIDNHSNDAYSSIDFKITHELPSGFSNKEAIELLAEKLKQDFIKFALQ